MKQIVNKDGEPIRGLFRNLDGSIVVNDPVAYNKAVLEANREKEFIEMKDRVNKMEDMLSAIYKKLMES